MVTAAPAEKRVLAVIFPLAMMCRSDRRAAREIAMSKTLILTEKPSVARDIAQAYSLGGKTKGYIEGNNVVITWAVGHLLQSSMPEDYDPAFKQWELRSLPILPEEFTSKPVPKVKEQLDTINKLLHREDIERVVIATDAGREGELIGREILQYANYRKAVYRFWTSQALTRDVIRSTMSNLRPASEFKRLYQAAKCRNEADWMVGINLSRCVSLKIGNEVYSVGRVQTAVLALLVDRLREREQFKPKDFWVLKARFQNGSKAWEGSWFKKTPEGYETRFWTEKEAEAVAGKIKDKTGKVLSVSKQKKKQPPPLLHSLTELQKDANKRFGFSAQKTLDLAQKLYETHKCLSYPRTESRHLGSTMVSKVNELIERLSKPYANIFGGIDKKLVSAKNKRVFDDARLTDHHALLPLAPVPSSASEDEKKVYGLVLKRFAAVFYPDYEYQDTLIVTEIEKETFSTRGMTVINAGWTALYGEKEDKVLPDLSKKDSAQHTGSEIQKDHTKPPAHYTEATLLADMTNPAKYVPDETLKKIYKGDVGLGTQATRAQIIETLLKRGYISREKKQLVALPKGCTLIDYLRSTRQSGVLTSPEETAKWEAVLNRIASGDGDPTAFNNQIKGFTKMAVDELKNSDGTPVTPPPIGIGKCPLCGGDVIEGKKGYGCSNWKSQNCGFVIWKEIGGKELSLENIKTLLKGQTTPEYSFKSREGKKFKARLKMETQDGECKVSFVFPGSESIGKCPLCGSEVRETEKGYGCSNWKNGCRFTIWKTIAGKKISEKVARDLLSKGRTDKIDGFRSKKGSTFRASLILDKEDGEGKVKLVFQ
jgi:DNA topoisomerase III